MLQHSKHTSLRERLLRFNVAVLRVVAAACAGLPHSKQASAALCNNLTESRGHLSLHMSTSLKMPQRLVLGAMAAVMSCQEPGLPQPPTTQ